MFESVQNSAKGVIITFNDLKLELNRSFVADSHELAHWDNIGEGEAQKQPGLEARDLGWHNSVTDMSDILIEGIPNDNLFAMIRRFNKVSVSLAIYSTLTGLFRMFLTFGLCHWGRTEDLIEQKLGIMIILLTRPRCIYNVFT